jgi:hypothetical protein
MHNTKRLGEHYDAPIQPVDFIVKNDIPFREGNVIKYVCRHRSKNGREDIEKAIDYLEMILKDYDAAETSPVDSYEQLSQSAFRPPSPPVFKFGPRYRG